MALDWRFPGCRAARSASEIAASPAPLAGLSPASMAHANIDPGHDKLWEQVLAASLGYEAFLTVLAAALGIRTLWWRRS